MARRRMGPHRRAVTRMLRATGLVHVPEEAPLVELVKELADEMDERPGARTRADYLSALKDVRRVLAVGARPTSSADPKPMADLVDEVADAASAEPAAPVNSLAAFREKRGIG